jgi:hypothetical protein
MLPLPGGPTVDPLPAPARLGQRGDETMVDHIFNEVHSGEVLHELRANAERARLVSQITLASRRAQGARTGILTGIFATCLRADVKAGLQTAN